MEKKSGLQEIKMNLSELLKDKIVLETEKDEKTAFQLLESAENDLITAKDNLKLEHTDWALAIAYNSMLSAGRALMAFKGYRTSGESQHLSVVKFCLAVLPAYSDNLIASFNRYRVRRHNVVYGESGSVSESEAKNAIENAKKFIEKVKKKIS